MAAMRPALLLIDLQRDFFRDPRLGAQRPGIEKAAAELLGLFRERGDPVLHVLTRHKADGSDWPKILLRRNEPTAIEGTPGCEPLERVRPAPGEAVVWKTRYSGFFGTDLDRRLAEAGADLLVIAGVNTHACIRMTALDAYQRDYDVALAREAIGTWDEEHGRVSLAYLEGRAARLLAHAEIAALLASGRGLWEG